MLQESSKEESNTEKDEGIIAEEDTQVAAEERLEEVDLETNSQEPKPLLISSKLSEKEKSELILLLKEFKDVFAWDYNEMPELDPRLVVLTLNVDLKAKSVAQPAKVFHTEIE